MSTPTEADPIADQRSKEIDKALREVGAHPCCGLSAVMIDFHRMRRNHKRR